MEKLHPKSNKKKGKPSKLAQYPSIQQQKQKPIEKPPEPPFPFKVGDRVLFKGQSYQGTIQQVYPKHKRIEVLRDTGILCEVGPEHIEVIRRKKKKHNKDAVIKNPKTHWHVDIEDISTGEL